MFISMSLGAIVKHVVGAGVVGFVAGVGSALLYQKIKGCDISTAVIMTKDKEKINKKSSSLGELDRYPCR